VPCREQCRGGLCADTRGVEADDRQRRITRSQRRYLDAILALAKVRRLALPVVQVNVAEKQVNIGALAGGAPA